MSHPLSDAIYESHLAVLRAYGLPINEALLREMANNAAQAVMGALEKGAIAIEVDPGFGLPIITLSNAIRDEEHQAWERQWAAPC